MAEMSNPVDVMGRELPYSQEAELAVIGSALTNPHSVAAVSYTHLDVYKRQESGIRYRY